MVDTKKLEELASRLNKASDEVNATLQKVQAKLNGMNIGIETWMLGVPLFSQDMELALDDDGNFITPFPGATTRADEVYLGYAKTSEGWGLAIQRKEVYYGTGTYININRGLEEVGSYNVGNPEPLLKASRDIRIEALGQLQRLIDLIVSTAEAAIVDIENARKLADEL